ncbi:diacylglycerol/lipid kinase family protein [Qipengyuania marisflavi]|uniref:DAGKc domain-containing protein n=1 Tax=Qipengyuania marisflavi TaxID=2486356 RepID=A0A5S3P8Y4_9SPHN|nr:diacylglycerol kinase family protein [Qipengyuania marisflavi]TMM48904.1 hypothetical protein FEV51_05855 [Qipengyuania marisflavi]
MIRIDLFYNPYSGGFRAPRLAALVEALAAEGFAVTQRETSLEPIQVSAGCELVCIHGGDGALRDTVAALGTAAGQVPLCVAPTGTINLVARELGYAAEPRKFASALRAAWDRGQDSWVHAPLYTLGELPVVSCLSIGPDSHAVSRVSSALKMRIGRYAYVVALLRQMRDWPRNPMTVRGELATGEVFECEAEAVIASHGALFAGPFRLSPKAALTADAVELITLHRSTRLGTLALALAAMLHLPIAKLRLAEIRSIRRASFNRCVTPVQVDGDHFPDCAYAIGPSGLTLRYVV